MRETFAFDYYLQTTKDIETISHEIKSLEFFLGKLEDLQLNITDHYLAELRLDCPNLDEKIEVSIRREEEEISSEISLAKDSLLRLKKEVFSAFISE